jgi:DNA-binding response OmpR family regulator
MISQRLRILFFDDDDDTREMTRLFFGEEGFEMVCAESAGDLLSLAQTQRFDGYLLDNWTSDLSGVESVTESGNSMVRRRWSFTPVQLCRPTRPKQWQQALKPTLISQKSKN